MLKKIASLAGVFALLVVMLFPLSVSAAGEEIRSVHITAELQQDGSAIMTEVWDISVSEGGELFVEKKNLGDMQISNLLVTDENGRVFEQVDRWNSNLSRQQRAYKSGIITTGDGYELCWGFGEYGRHTYTITYTLTDLVKAYSDTDGFNYAFLCEGQAASIDDVRITITKPNTTFTQNDTGIWAFSFSANVQLENGQIVAQSDARMRTSQRAQVMAEFDKGMFTPTSVQNGTFEDVKQHAFEGSDYAPGAEDRNGNFFTNINGKVLSKVLPIIGAVVAIFAVIGVGAAAKKHGATRQMKKEYKEAEYCRKVPYNGSLPTTYSRLEELGQLEADSAIIGAYMLRWIRRKQVVLTKEMGGMFGNKEEDAIRLMPQMPDMETMERRLYDMLVAAAGSDGILQSKEFEKWSKRNYEKIQGWLQQYKNLGKSYLRSMGAIAEAERKVFFGLIPTKTTVVTPVGEALTLEMFGFKKYLEDFTIINEREAREVQLWDEYLVFAQLFGIADKVGEQFKQLYPDYFVNMACDLGYQRLDLFDIYILTRITRNYGYAMHRGYQAGYNAAHTTRFTGGGGHSSFGGGGGFSGGGGSGSR